MRNKLMTRGEAVAVCGQEKNMEKLYKIINDKWTNDDNCVCRLSDIEEQAESYGTTVVVSGQSVLSANGDVVGVEVETGNADCEPTARERVQLALLAGQKPTWDDSQAVFATLEDTGWAVGSERQTWRPVVVTPDGVAVVGIPDEDGILWKTGSAYVVKGGDVDEARSNSIGFTVGCTAEFRWCRNYRVERGVGQTPVLIAK